MRHSSIFVPLTGMKRGETPVFIPFFNQPSLLEITLKQLESYDHGRIVIYDNNSEYQDAVEFLESISDSYDVVFSKKNSGPRIFTEDIDILRMMPENFVVTDPDLIYNENLPVKYIDEMKKTLVRLSITKIGFALEINDEEENSRFQDFDSVYQWEHPYWIKEIGKTSTDDPIYDAWIDTTFSLNSRDACLYQRKFGKPTFRYPSARIAGNYTCRHIGWWRKELMPQSPDEINHYLKTQKWSHTEIHYYR